MQNSRLSQWHVLKHDKWLLSSLTWLPVFLAVTLWWIFSQGLVCDLPVGIVDLENDTVSRTLVRQLDATSVMAVTSAYPNVYEARQALIAGNIYAYAVIPRHFTRDIYNNTPPQISVFYNSQYILVGKQINSAVNQAYGTFNTQAGALKQLSKGQQTFSGAAGQALPLRSQITPLFNLNSDYAQFLVSAIVPALWQIFIVVSTILWLTANYRIYGSKTMLGPQPVRRFISLCRFYLPFYLLSGFGFLSWFYTGLKWPMAGSLFPLIYAQLLTAVACIIMGSLFFFITQDPARAMSFAGVLTAPSFAFMGITFPATDMPLPAEIWRNLLPVSYYIEAQIGQSSYGVTSWQTITRFSLPMLGYLFPLGVTLLLIKKHHARQESDT
ncbi:multidrug ABC transporter permease [Vibrio albus]|uniref:Multidrug ABC transporter permease n=1 Tax=Vibrio albus TaxID=2200953 RepID=A0A2U3BBG9_9VIBR|nr:ABC transporter permease [Vibrio albus]PWI34123.1 multidrug ABC transporter permease [Vibrio albus]